MKPEIETIDFNDSTWRIVKREFIYRKDSISITFLPEKGRKLQISKAALKALGNPTYGQILINPKTHQLALMGSNAKMANSILLHPQDNPDADCSIPCEGFLNRVYDLMGWVRENKIVVRGHLTKKKAANNGIMLVFDLDHSCMYMKEAKQCERRPIRPTEYSERFGLEISSANLLQAEGHPSL